MVISVVDVHALCIYINSDKNMTLSIYVIELFLSTEVELGLYHYIIILLYLSKAARLK